jgi:hypothetical protein
MWPQIVPSEVYDACIRKRPSDVEVREWEAEKRAGRPPVSGKRSNRISPGTSLICRWVYA